MDKIQQNKVEIENLKFEAEKAARALGLAPGPQLSYSAQKTVFSASFLFQLCQPTGMSESFMVLNRNYSISPNKQIEDLTTYIDPVKFNYIFADTDLDAMNFWVQTRFDIKVRRLISARQIPNL